MNRRQFLSLSAAAALVSSIPVSEAATRAAFDLSSVKWHVPIVPNGKPMFAATILQRTPNARYLFKEWHAGFRGPLNDETKAIALDVMRAELPIDFVPITEANAMRLGRLNPPERA